MQVQINCLVKENGELKSQMVAREAEQKQMEELRGRITTMEVEPDISKPPRFLNLRFPG